MQEYRRAAHFLKDSQSSKAAFLRCYSLYLAGEKRKEEERIELSGPLGHAETVNNVSYLHGYLYICICFYEQPAISTGKDTLSSYAGGLEAACQDKMVLYTSKSISSH